MASILVSNWIKRVGFIGGATAVLVGCPEDAAEITETASPPSFDFPVTTGYVEPAGSFSIDRVVLAAIDTTVSDALGRTASFVVPEAVGISFVSGCPTSGAQCPGVEFPMRNAVGDGRLPGLQDPDASALAGVVADSIFGVPLLLLSASNLEPTTGYTVTLERLAVTVNNNLDVTHLLLNNPELGGLALAPDPAPDALARLGGAPGGSLGDNYYTIATFTTSPAGGAFITPTFVGSDAMFETNTVESFDLPEYNYMVVYLGDPSAGVPVLRGQFGVDLAPSAEPVNNALAPFPTAALTPGEVLAAPGGAGRPDSLQMTFNNLEALVGGAAYEAWLVNPGTGSSTRAVGTYNRIQIIADRDPVTGEIVSTRDSLVETLTGVSSFVGGNTEDGFRHQLIISDATLAGGGGGAADTIGVHSEFVLAIAESPGAESPPEARPLWFSYTDQSGTPDNFFDDSFNFSGATSFGNFDAADPSVSRIFNGEGGGLGGVRGDVLSVDLEALSRPPIGYLYLGWLVSADGTALRFPDITGPPPERVSLVNADVETVPGLVTANGILVANLRLLASDAGIEFKDFSVFLVTLEPKAGDPGMGSIPAQVGALPERVTNPPEEVGG